MKLPEQPGPVTAKSPAADQPAVAADVQVQQHYQAMVSTHLGRMLDHLFAEFTGLHFHVAWAPANPKEWDARTSPTGCSVCCRLAGAPKLPACRACGPRQIERVLKVNGEGARFLCRLGVRNFWITIRLRGKALGIAYLQALDKPPAGSAVWDGEAQVAGGRPKYRGARVLNRTEFDRAARLLQFIIRSVQSTSLAELRKADLTNAGNVVVALEREVASLHQVLQRHLPATRQVTRRPANESHARQLVEQALQVVARDYAQPLTLSQCARELGMNAAYLSSIFSRTVGVSFKAHLTAIRMEKAKALLSDPKHSTTEVAFAVGYASENRFRAVFKQATGLPPKSWREALLVRSASGGQLRLAGERAFLVTNSNR
jgi:AraC-like DNA-binding protein